MSTAVQSISHSHFPLFGASKRTHEDAFFKEPTYSWGPSLRRDRDSGLSVKSLTSSSPKVEPATTISALKPEPREDDVTLPPLREAIPEYQSHNPQDAVGEKPSPTCPGEGFVPQMQTETEGPCDSLPVSIPSPKRRRMSQKEPFKYQPFSPPDSLHKAHSTRATNSAEPDLPRHSHLGGSPLSRARALHRPTASLTDVPRSSGLPPFSFHSSRGSSSDVDSERPQLPTLFVGTGQTSYPRERYADSPVSSDMSPSYGSYIHSPPMRRASPVGRPSTSYPTMGYTSAAPFVGRGMEKPMFGGGPHRHDIGVDYYEPGASSKRRRGNLPKHVTELLRAWLHDHLDHPYPTEDEKQMLMSQTGLTISQISNWFINARRRRVPGITNARQSLDAGKSAQNRRATSD